MRPTEIGYFALTLFLALVALIHWARRRARVAARLNRGLRGYVATKGPDTQPKEGTPGEKLISV